MPREQGFRENQHFKMLIESIISLISYNFAMIMFSVDWHDSTQREPRGILHLLSSTILVISEP